MIEGNSLILQKHILRMKIRTPLGMACCLLPYVVKRNVGSLSCNWRDWKTTKNLKICRRMIQKRRHQITAGSVWSTGKLQSRITAVIQTKATFRSQVTAVTKELHSSVHLIIHLCLKQLLQRCLKWAKCKDKCLEMNWSQSWDYFQSLKPFHMMWNP